MVMAIAILCGLVFWPAPTQAALITIEIEAVVDSVWDESNYLEGKIESGDVITGFYVYESTTPDSSPLDPVQGNYWHYAAPAGIALTAGGFNFMTDPFSIAFHVAIRNDIPPEGGDSYAIVSYSNLPLFNGVRVDEILWSLKDPTGTAFSRDALPTTSPVLGQWGETLLRMHGERGGYIVDAHVTSAVPEPVTIILLSMGGLFLRKRS